MKHISLLSLLLVAGTMQGSMTLLPPVGNNLTDAEALIVQEIWKAAENCTTCNEKTREELRNKINNKFPKNPKRHTALQEGIEKAEKTKSLDLDTSEIAKIIFSAMIEMELAERSDKTSEEIAKIEMKNKAKIEEEVEKIQKSPECKNCDELQKMFTDLL